MMRAPLRSEGGDWTVPGLKEPFWVHSGCDFSHHFRLINCFFSVMHPAVITAAAAASQKEARREGGS